MLLRLLRNKRAQSTAEYAILIGVVVAGVIAMQTYVKRGMQGRIKNVVDHTGTGGTVGGSSMSFTGSQYEPYYLQTTFNNTDNTTDTENTAIGGSVARTTNRTATRTGTQQQLAPE